MKLSAGRCALAVSMAAMVSLILVVGLKDGRSQDPPPLSHQTEDTRLPNGKLQRDEILKAEHQQNLKDAAQLSELTDQLKEDLEKNDRYVLSVSTLKKLDDIEKLVKKIRSRMRHN